MELIKRVIDRYFKFVDERNGNLFLAAAIPASMVDEVRALEKGKGSEWTYWLAIESTVSARDLGQLEQFFGRSLPASYKLFLQHRHFVELELGERSISFFKNRPGSLLSDVRAQVEANYEDLPSRGLLPFAALSDYGVVCFDARLPEPDSDYPVVTLDHEDGFEHVEFYVSSFLELFEEFEPHLEDWIKRMRERDAQASRG